MENQEEQNININANSAEDNQATLDEDRDKKKKARILIAVELILLILVILLAIIFFSSRSGANFGINIFNREDNNKIVNNAPQSGGLVTNTNNNNSQDSNIPVVNNPNVSTPSSGNSQVVESVRLSLPVPSQSPVSSEEEIPTGAIKILGLEDGFSPNEFRVGANEEITLALTSRIDYPVILTFYEETMPAISIGCGPRETRWVTFTTPNTPGRYTFRNDVFGKSGQTGVMIVE